MNKSLFDTRVKSIAHYKKQINDIEDSLKENRDVLKDLISSLVEFFPFEAGDILINGTDIILVDMIKKSNEEHVSIEVKLPDGKGGWSIPSYFSYRERNIKYADFGLWKKIGDNKKEESSED